MPRHRNALPRPCTWQLRNVGLDKSRVYNIRDVTLDRAAFHITFDDGTIAFTEDVAGRITGAFFEGEGEVLLVPRDQAERASMTLFTGAAILEEKFVTAYFRFNDDTFAELKPSLRPTDHTQEFVTQWDGTARNLAETDALRLLLSFSTFAASIRREGNRQSRNLMVLTDGDRMLHARVQGSKLGIFDLYFDSMTPEQVWAGQLKTVDGDTHYDVWTSFSVDQPAGRSEAASGVLSEGARPDTIKVSQYTDPGESGASHQARWPTRPCSLTCDRVAREQHSSSCPDFCRSSRLRRMGSRWSSFTTRRSRARN